MTDENSRADEKPGLFTMPNTKCFICKKNKYFLYGVYDERQCVPAQLIDQYNACVHDVTNTMNIKHTTQIKSTFIFYAEIP